jgi:ABC-type transport system substrate-binding protein
MQGKLGHYYQNPPLKEKLDEANRTLDERKRRAMYSEIQQVFRDEAVKIYLFQYAAIYGTSARVRFTPPEDEILRFYDLVVSE